MKSLDHFLDRSLPAQGRVAHSRASWMSFGISRPIGGVEKTNSQHPGEGSA